MPKVIPKDTRNIYWVSCSCFPEYVLHKEKLGLITSTNQIYAQQWEKIYQKWENHLLQMTFPKIRYPS